MRVASAVTGGFVAGIALVVVWLKYWKYVIPAILYSQDDVEPPIKRKGQTPGWISTEAQWARSGPHLNSKWS